MFSQYSNSVTIPHDKSLPISFHFLLFLISNRVSSISGSALLSVCPFSQKTKQVTVTQLSHPVFDLLFKSLSGPTEAVLINLLSLGHKAYLGKENGPLY